VASSIPLVALVAVGLTVTAAGAAGAAFAFIVWAANGYEERLA
jgi:hypothetical protein